MMRASGAGWPAIGWLTLRWMRRRWMAMVPIVLIVVVGTAGTMIALTAAERTSSAYGDYLERANVGDVVINPSTNTREIEQVIRSLPGVERVTTDSLFSVTNDEGEPRLQGDLEDSGGSTVVGVRGSADGRYVDMDRPVVRRGRLATGPDEVVVTRELADEFGVEIGDVVPLAFWRAVPDLPDGKRFEAMRAETVSPIGVEHLTVVGIVALATEVLPDDLYPRQTAIVSPDVAARYDCVPPTPPPGSVFDEFIATMNPPDCATQYRYYSLSLNGGAAAVKRALDAFLLQASAMQGTLAASVDLDDADIDEPPQYFLIPTETEPERRRVERSIRPTVAALGVLAAAAAVTTLALLGLAVARELRRTQRDQRQWHQLGVGSAARTAVIGTPPAAASVAGVLVAVAAVWLVDVGPVGLVRPVDAGSRHPLAGVAVTAAAGVALLGVTLVAILAARAARRPDAPAAAAGPRGGARGVFAMVGPPPVADGVRAAYGQRAAIPMLAGGVLLSAAFVAAVVFGASLSALVSTPRSYGWPWDAGAMAGGGYGDLDLGAAQKAFDGDQNVEHWAAIGFFNEVSLDGEPTTAMLAFDRLSDLDLPVLRGELPRASDEVAVGATTAADRGIAVGDTVRLTGGFPQMTATVTGIVVFPGLGPLYADRVGVGTGLLLPQDLVDVVSRSLGDARDLAAFVGVDLRDDATTPEALARVSEQLDPLDALGFPVFKFLEPVRPPEIIDARSTRSVPVAVGALLATTASIGLGFASWASVRSRRRDLAVLRTLGFSGAQVRRSVRVQVLATTLGALVVGVPIGVLAGRFLWLAFADQLGVVPDHASPWPAVLLAVGGGVVVAVAAAQVPAQIAARMDPAEGLRAE